MDWGKDSGGRHHALANSRYLLRVKTTPLKKGAPFTREVEAHYSVTDVAERLDVARQTVSEWVSDCRIQPVYRISKTCVRIPASAINRFLKSSKRAPKAVYRTQKAPR